MQEESRLKNIEQLKQQEQGAKLNYDQPKEQKLRKESELYQIGQTICKTKCELKTVKLKNMPPM